MINPRSRPKILAVLIALVQLAIVSSAKQRGRGSSPAMIQTDLESSVAEITFSSMDHVLKDSHKQVWLLEFYAPWCDHCKALAPVYEQASHQVRGLRFAKIDATWGPNQAVSRRYDVEGYPTIFWIRDGFFRPFRGSQSVHGFAQLAQKIHSSPVTELQSEDGHEVFMEQHATFFLFGYSATRASDKEMADMFKTVSMRFQDELTFAVTAVDSLLSQYNTKQNAQAQGKGKSKSGRPFIVKVHAHARTCSSSPSVRPCLCPRNVAEPSDEGEWHRTVTF